MESSSNSDPHEKGGPSSNKNVTIAHIMDCPTITLHAGNCYKALIDSGAAISLVRYSTYQNIDSNLKIAIQSMSVHLNTVDRSPMTALGIITLQLWIADFKVSHNFIICDRLPDTEILFDIDVQKKFALSYAWDKEKNCYIQKEGRFFTYIRNCDQKANVTIVKSTLKIPPRHNCIIPIKIKGHTMKGLTAYFIKDQDLKKGRIPTYMSLMEFTTSKEKHMLMFLS